MSYSDNSNRSYRVKPSTTTKESKKEIISDRIVKNSGKPLGNKTRYVSTELFKCWSCPEVPNEWGRCCEYILYKSAKMSAICRDHRHRIYPISFHDKVRCMLCEVNDINPEDLGVHYHHPLTGQTDWSRDYGE